MNFVINCDMIINLCCVFLDVYSGLVNTSDFIVSPFSALMLLVGHLSLENLSPISPIMCLMGR